MRYDSLGADEHLPSIWEGAWPNVGLAWLGNASGEAPAATMDDVKTYLEGLEKKTLVRMVMEQAMEDEQLRERLLLRAARMDGLDLAVFHKAIDGALDFGEFPEYVPPWEFVRDIDNVVASIEELIEEGFASEVVELSEYALSAVEGVMDCDVDGSMGNAIYDLEKIRSPPSTSRSSASNTNASGTS